MIKSVVSLLNKWHRLTSLTPREIIENRYPHATFERVSQHQSQLREQVIYEQKLNAEKANATPLEVEFINLREEYNKGKINEDAYEDKYQQLKDKQRHQNLASKLL